MAHPRITYQSEPVSVCWRVALGALCMLIITLCGMFLLSLEESKSETPKMAHTATLANPFGPTPEHISQSDNTSVADIARETVTSIVEKQRAKSTPPPYGADAIGEKGAWDGREGVANVATPPVAAADKTPLKDYQGRNCDNKVSSELPIETLRTLVPPPGYPDSCGYRPALLAHKDILPSDFFSETMSEWSAHLYESDVVRISKNHQWSIGDIERLIPRSLSAGGALQLFILLRDRGSRETETLRRAEKDFGFIEEFIRTGKCPASLILSSDGPCTPYMTEEH